MRSFTPHIGISADTRPAGKVALQKLAGTNLNSSFLLNSLTVAVTDRIELGTVPLLWFSSSHRWNLGAKLGVYDSGGWGAALGLSAAHFVLSGARSLSMQSAIAGVNYRPEGRSWWWGAVGGVSRSEYDGRFVTRILGTPYEFGRWYTKWVPELGVDASYSFGGFDLTWGAGYLRDYGFSAFESANWGGGVTAAWYRPGCFLSKPALGLHYAPSSRNWRLLFSTTFY